MSNDLQTGNLSQEWMDKLAAAAKEQAATEKPTGNFFSTKGGLLSWNSMGLPGNKMDVIVLAACHENVFYGGVKFDAANPASPICYAFSTTGNDIVPHPEVEVQQAASCKTCRNMKWGTGDGGKGTACRPIRRLALLPASAAASVDAAEKAVCGLLRVPITSVANWTLYVNMMANKQLPTFAVVCEVALIPDAKSMFKMTFQPKHPIDNPAVLNALMLRVPIEQLAMQAPYMRRTGPGVPVIPGSHAPVQTHVTNALAAAQQPHYAPPAAPAQPASPPAFGAPPAPSKF